MKNLGKIIFIFIFLLFPHAMFASIKATLDSNYVELGDMVTYSLTISGDDVKRPNISTLCDSDVVSSSSQRSIQMINGDVKKSYVLSYKFVPQKSCEIPPISMEVDGKVEKSNSVSLKITSGVVKKDASFVLTLSSDKKEVYVGEPFKVTLLFKQREDAEAIDSKFIAPKLKGFWIKKESKPTRYKDGRYVITKLTYTMAAQRVGDLKISRAQMAIASRANTRDSWGAWIPQVKWKTYFSNSLDMKVKPLPKGVELVGNFSIKATVDKTEINSNEALNVVVEVDGIGNLEDIKSFKPYIDGVSVFDEKIVIKDDKLSQKMAFVADKDFTIPSFSLKYFDTKTSEMKTIQTQSIDIKVKGAKAQVPLRVRRAKDSKEKPQKVETQINYESSNLLLFISFIVGLACGIIVMFLKPWKFKTKDKTLNIKDDKALLMKLLPHKDDEEVQAIVDILENNIYSDKKINIDKKRLKKIIKKYF